MLTSRLVQLISFLFTTQLILAATFTSSTGQGDFKPEFAMDGRMDTRWSSNFSDNEWLLIEFEEIKTIVGINIHWETAYGRDYNIELLDENNRWHLQSQIISSDGGIDAIYFGPQKCRAIKLVGFKRGTGWGYSIWEIDLLGLDKKRSVSASSTLGNCSPDNIMDGRTDTFWQPQNTTAPVTLTIQSPEPVETGGLRIQWAQDTAGSCSIQYYNNDTWQTLVDKKPGVSSTEDIFFDKITTTKLRLVFAPTKEQIRISEIQLKQPSESWTPERHFEMLAQQKPDGLFPGWLRREQTFWTITGLPGSFNESLIDEYGKVETGFRNFSVTPALLVNDKLISTKSFISSQSLHNDWMPIPSVSLLSDDLKIKITANTIEPDSTIVHYEITNTTSNNTNLSFLLAVRPLPINPPWQHGGFSPIEMMEYSKAADTLSINKAIAASFYPKPDYVSLYSQKQNADMVDITDQLISRNTQSDSISSEVGLCTAGMRYDYSLSPGQTKSILAVYPNNHASKTIVPEDYNKFFHDQLKLSEQQWSNLIENWQIDLPDTKLVNILKSNLAYLVINADGPATQPGSRNYNSSWIRDGSVSATAMMRFGMFQQGLDYLNWFTGLIKDDGFVPFLVHTKTGQPEWFATSWQEHDSFGQYVYLVRQAAELTNDYNVAKHCWPKVIATMKYMQQLRLQRLTDQYKGTVYEGILPESNSHEGYFPAKHSYWDDFFAIKGIQDAKAIAASLGFSNDAEWLSTFETDFRESLLTSIDRVRKRDNLNLIPGCAEMGDFDPTSTSVGIMIADERDTLPQDAIKNSYDRYVDEIKHRISMPPGTRPTYTPYEVRNISALIRLGRSEDAAMLLDYFMEDAVRPIGWNHMAEVVHGDLRTPSYIGDMPHTWVGAGLCNAIRDMLVYEERNSLVLAAAVPQSWLLEGVSVKNLQTWYGPISYDIKQLPSGQVVLKLKYTRKPPKGFIVPEGVKLIAKQQ